MYILKYVALVTTFWELDLYPFENTKQDRVKKKLETKIIILQFRQRSPHQKYIVLKHKKNDIAQYRVERQMLNFSAKI